MLVSPKWRDKRRGGTRGQGRSRERGLSKQGWTQSQEKQRETLKWRELGQLLQLEILAFSGEPFSDFPPLHLLFLDFLLLTLGPKVLPSGAWK
jgi:hypothetical protein